MTRWTYLVVALVAAAAAGAGWFALQNGGVPVEADLAHFDTIHEFIDERLMGVHLRFEVSVLGFEVGEYFRILDVRVRRVLEPVVGILNRDSVVGEPMRYPRRNWWLGHPFLERIEPK